MLTNIVIKPVQTLKKLETLCLKNTSENIVVLIEI